MEGVNSKKDKPIVFIHGLMGSKNSFRYLECYFPNSRSFDLIGFGAEKKPEVVYDIELFLAFLENKINEPCVIVGYSMGAILAKEFALRHPELVERLYFINYPLSDSQGLECAIRKDLFISMYIDGRILTRWMCNVKVVYKFFLAPFAFIFFRKYFRSFWDRWFHTYTSCSSALRNVVLTDNYRTLLPLREKEIFITGEKDNYTDPRLLEFFHSYRISGMAHSFFRHEEEIAEIIRSTIATPVI